MAKPSRVYKLLEANAGQAMTVFVSVDPGRDTSSVLKSYLAYFHMNSIGLTGTKEEIDAVVHQYGARSSPARAQAVRITFTIHS